MSKGGRQPIFILYRACIRNNLSNDRYLNFLALHVSLTILTSKRNFNHLNYEHQLLQYFVKTFVMLYGPEHASHNVHNLLHITADVAKFCLVDEFSCFPFENFIQCIFKSIRKPADPLEQIVKRHSEQVDRTVHHSHKPTFFSFLYGRT